MGNREIWGSYKGRKGIVSGSIGERKCVEVEMFLVCLEGEWMNLVVVIESGGEYC